MMKVEDQKEEDAYLHAKKMFYYDSDSQSATCSPVPRRHFASD